jgi:hypothetical protein
MIVLKTEINIMFLECTVALCIDKVWYKSNETFFATHSSANLPIPAVTVTSYWQNVML